jgi:hypothetical protein
MRVRAAPTRAIALLAPLAFVLFSTREARAYRPFDGTDADVAGVGEFELELGPVHYFGTRDAHYLIAPATVLNLGLVKNLELVVDFKNFVALDKVPNEDPVRLLDTDVFLKYLLREGTLQGKTGWGFAIEAGPLTPNINGQNSFGASLNTILSYEWPSTTVHFNNQIQYTRAQNIDLFSSVILEGSKSHALRPVAEFFFEHEFNLETKYSALFGGIWELSHEFQLDAGWRMASEAGEPVTEIRLGFTWTLPIWAPKETEPSAGKTARLFRWR